MSVKKKKNASVISFWLSIALELVIITIFLLSAFHKLVMYEALLWVIILFVVVYWTNSFYNGMCVDSEGKSVLSKNTRKAFNIVSTISSIALFLMGALVFIDYYFVAIF